MWRHSIPKINRLSSKNLPPPHTHTQKNSAFFFSSFRSHLRCLRESVANRRVRRHRCHGDRTVDGEGAAGGCAAARARVSGIPDRGRRAGPTQQAGGAVVAVGVVGAGAVLAAGGCGGGVVVVVAVAVDDDDGRAGVVGAASAATAGPAAAAAPGAAPAAEEPASSSAAAAPHGPLRQPDHLRPEPGAEGAVDEAVDGPVDDQEQVRDVRDHVHPRLPGRHPCLLAGPGLSVDHHLVNAHQDARKVGDEEEEDDAHEDNGQVVLVPDQKENMAQ